MKAYDHWTILPHSPIERLTENLWRVEGCHERQPLRRVMTLAKRADGAVVIHSAIALTEPEMVQIEAWGEPTYLLVPNHWHRSDAKIYRDRYPGIRVLCPRAERREVEEVVAVDGDLDSYPGDDEAVIIRHLHGAGDCEGVMIVRSSSGSALVFNDLIFNMPHSPGVMGLLYRYLAGSTGGPRITRLSRLLLVKDRRLLRAELEELAETPQLKRIIVSHHEMITLRPADTLRRLATEL